MRETMTAETQARQGTATFVAVWLGQVCSLVGSTLTGFALSVWVYRNTGSVTQFSVVILFTMLPGILVSPLAGTLIDRFDRRALMILSNVWSALWTAGVALLFAFGTLHLWHVCALAAAISASGALLSPAFTASVSQVVPKRHLGRASGMMQFGEAAAQTLAPLFGGFLVLTINISGVLLIDVITYAFAVATLLFIRLPRATPAAAPAGEGGLLREAASGWRYIVGRRGLFWLLLFFAATNFTVSLGNVLLTPLVLSFADAAVYGTVASALGAGLIVGSVLMGVWGGPRRRVQGIFAYGLALGLMLMLEGLRPSALLIGAGVFVTGCFIPVANGCFTPILQSKTPHELQGRVFAAVRLVAWCTAPAAYLAAGPLADRVFGPLLDAGGPLAPSVGLLLGVGRGRGIGLLLMAAGAATLAVTARAYLTPRLHDLEEEVPDVIADKAVAGA
jgi:DHA3 family macrolide efflux protein-like MFS transporter